MKTIIFYAQIPQWIRKQLSNKWNWIITSYIKITVGSKIFVTIYMIL